MQHFLSVNQLSVKELFSILELAEKERQNETIPDLPSQLYAANLFFEPSTRTNASFLMAQKKLGIETLDFHCATSSVTKGETLYDTAKTYEAIGADLLVIRHPDDRWYEGLPANIDIPLINAGAGKGEHPTQCLLDVLTIYQEFGQFLNKNIVIAGDIRHSRVARSNAIALKKLGANVYVSGAPTFMDPTMDIPYLSMDEAVEMCDVLMLLRIQYERHTEHYGEKNGVYLKQYGLSMEREQRMKPQAIVMHPAPVNRDVEIDTRLVEAKRSRIFKQMENGVYVRMAIIIKLLQEWGKTHDFTNQCKKITAY